MAEFLEVTLSEHQLSLAQSISARRANGTVTSYGLDIIGNNYFRSIDNLSRRHKQPVVMTLTAETIVSTAGQGSIKNNAGV